MLDEKVSEPAPAGPEVSENSATINTPEAPEGIAVDDSTKGNLERLKSDPVSVAPEAQLTQSDDGTTVTKGLVASEPEFLSLAEPPKEENPFLSLEMVEDSTFADPKLLEEKSQKWALGVGESPEIIRKQLEQPDGEARLRQLHADREDIARRELRNTLLLKITQRTGRPLTATDIVEWDALVNFDTAVDPKTVLEEAYAKKFSDLAWQTAKDVKVVKTPMAVMPGPTLDLMNGTKDAVTRREIANTHVQKLSKDFEKGWGPLKDTLLKVWYGTYELPSDLNLNKAFRGEHGTPDEATAATSDLIVDLAKIAFIPLYSNIKTGGWALWQGDATKEEYQNLSLLPPAEFKKAFEARIEAFNNLPMALEWAAGYLEYSNNDAAIADLFGLADWVGSAALGFGAIYQVARLGYVGVKGYRTANVVSKADEAAFRATLDEELSRARALPEGEDASEHVKEFGEAKRNEPNQQVKDFEAQKFTRDLETGLTREAASEEQLEHIKDFRRAAMDTIKAANETTPEAMSATLGDVDTAAHITAHKRAVRESEGLDPLGQGDDLRSKTLSIYHPAHIFGDVGNLQAGQVAQIEKSLFESATIGVNIVNLPPGVERLTPDQLKVAIELTQAELLRRNPDAATALLDIGPGFFKVYGMDETNRLAPNVKVVEMHVGKLPTVADTPEIGAIPNTVFREDVGSSLDQAFSDGATKAVKASKLGLTKEEIEELRTAGLVNSKGQMSRKRYQAWAKERDRRSQQGESATSTAPDSQPAASVTPEITAIPDSAFNGDTLNQLERTFAVAKGNVALGPNIGVLPEELAALKKAGFVDDKGEMSLAQFDAFNKERNRRIASRQTKSSAPPKSTPEPVATTRLRSEIKTLTKDGRVLVRDLYDQLKAAGKFEGTLEDFRKTVDDMRKSGTINMSAHADPLPDNLPPFQKEAEVPVKWVGKGKRASSPRKKKEPEVLEEGNWTSESARDIGHGNATLRNRVIDSELTVRPRSQHKEPVAAHYVEPDGRSTPPPKVLYNPAPVATHGELLDALEDLQNQIGQTPNKSLNKRVASAIKIIEKKIMEVGKGAAPTAKKGKKAKGAAPTSTPDNPLDPGPTRKLVTSESTPEQIAWFKKTEQMIYEYLGGLATKKKVVRQHKLGRTGATLFKDRATAVTYAEKVYGIAPGDYSIRQQGGGYYISISMVVPEVHSPTRDLAVKNNAVREHGFLASIGMGVGADQIFPALTNANRKGATYGPSHVHELVKSMAPDLIALRSKERDEIEQMLIAHRKHQYTETSASGAVKSRRGKFNETLGEFEREFTKRTGHLPSVRQASAYFQYVQLHDVDLALRDLGFYRDVARLGLEKTTVGFHIDDPANPGTTNRTATRPFASLLVDKLPLADASGENFGVWVYDSHAKSGHFYTRNELTADVLADIDLKTQAHGYKILQVANPTEKPMRRAAGTDEIVNFIVVKDYHSKQYDWNNIPKRPGGHVVYKHENSVSQPIIRKSTRDGKVSWVYEGDSIALNVRTEAQGKTIAEAMEQGRQLMKAGRHDEAKEVIERNTPYDYGDFRKDFQTTQHKDGSINDPKYDIDQPFTYTTHNMSTMEMAHFKGHKLQYGDAWVDVAGSQYNIFANNIDKKFLGERHHDVDSVSESFAKSEPRFVLEPPELIDPFEMINYAMANVARSKYFNDLKIYAAETFIEQFHTVMDTPLEVMRRNPVYYLNNPDWTQSNLKDAWPKIVMGKHARQAHLHLLGTDSLLGQGLAYTQQKTLNKLYLTRNWGDAPFSNSMAWAIENLEPVKFVRAAVFHYIMGTFNPTQFFKQAQGMAAVTAITLNPKRTSRSWVRSVVARWLLNTEDPEKIERISRLVSGRTTHITNFDHDHFMEAFRYLKESGFHNIGGEHTAKDNLFDPRVSTTMAGEFLDKGTFFYKEGERATRLLAWFSAFDEWRAKNPTKALSIADRNTILDRADDMSVNMSKASNANIQNGSFQDTLRFYSYPMRLSEAILGTKLTWQEKTSLVLTNMLLYGIPVGATGALVYPFYSDVTKYLLEQGYDLTDYAVQQLHDGIMSVALTMATGEQYTVGPELGGGGFSSIKKFLNDEIGWLEFLAGATGSAVGDFIRGAHGVSAYLMTWLDSSYAPPTTNDLIDFVETIGTVSKGMQAYYMALYGDYITKNERKVLGGETKTSTQDALMRFFLGFQPAEATVAYALKDIEKDRDKVIKEAKETVTKHMQIAFEHESRGEFEEAMKYRQAAEAGRVVIPPEQWAGVVRDAMRANIPLIEKAMQNYIKNSPDIETRLNRIRQMNKIIKKKEIE
jgi:hypothetical protein